MGYGTWVKGQGSKVISRRSKVASSKSQVARLLKNNRKTQLSLRGAKGDEAISQLLRLPRSRWSLAMTLFNCLVASRRKLAVGIFLSLLLVNLFWALNPAFALTTTEVAREFICNCGCNKILDACDMQCGEQLRGVITQKINQGWSKERIVAYMMKNYGEALLAAPTKKGFNLTAWITPFVLIAIGWVLIYLVIIKWVRKGKELEEVETEERVAKKVGLEYEEKLEDELGKFEH